MLDTLLESKSRSERSVAGAIVSVTAHTALIAAALYATAQARAKPTATAQMVRPLYFPLPRTPVASESRLTLRSLPTQRHSLTFVPPRIEVNVPAVDITAAATSPRDFGARPIGADGSAAGEETNIGGSKGPFLPEQVEKQAALAPGNAPPRYPEALRSAGVEGKVIAVFTVEETGRAEPESIRFVSSDNQLFEEAVRVALGRMRFVPAEVRGRKVRQLVQMPFVFTLGR